jgi:hypothetical protein
LRANPRNPNYQDFHRRTVSVLAFTLAALGDHVAAARRAGELAGLNIEPVEDTYDAACVLSLCVPAAARDGKLPEVRRTELAAEYGAGAMRLLRLASQKGYADAGNVLKDHDLDPIRRRADFPDFLWGLANAGPLKPP